MKIIDLFPDLDEWYPAMLYDRACKARRKARLAEEEEELVNVVGHALSKHMAPVEPGKPRMIEPVTIDGEPMLAVHRVDGSITYEKLK